MYTAGGMGVMVEVVTQLRERYGTVVSCVAPTSSFGSSLCQSVQALGVVDQDFVYLLRRQVFADLQLKQTTRDSCHPSAANRKRTLYCRPL